MKYFHPPTPPAPHLFNHYNTQPFGQYIHDELDKGVQVTLFYLHCEVNKWKPVSYDELRKALKRHFGARITFARGRYGGIRLSTEGIHS